MSFEQFHLDPRIAAGVPGHGGVGVQRGEGELPVILSLDLDFERVRGGELCGRRIVGQGQRRRRQGSDRRDRGPSGR